MTGRRKLRPAEVVSPRAMGEQSRAKVLRSLADHDPLSRSELSRIAGVSRGTMSAIVQRLIDDGLLVEQEPVESGRVGKPATPVWFAAAAGSVVAVQIAVDEARATRIGARGERAGLVTAPIRDPGSGDDVVAAAVEVATRVDPAGVLGLGLSVPGACDAESGTVLASARVPGAVGPELAAAVADAVGVPVLVENDSTAEALAELWFGHGRRLDSFVSVHTGAGLGAGLVLSGLVHRGARGHAGEVGHMPVSSTGRPARAGSRVAGRRSHRSRGSVRRPVEPASTAPTT